MEHQIEKFSIKKAWGLCFTASFFYGLQYILRLLPNVLQDDYIIIYKIDASDFGNFNALYYMGYAFFHLPAGLLLDRWGPKYTLSLSVLLCGLGIIPPLLAPSWSLALLGRILLGIGSSSAILGVFYIIRIYFPATKFSSVLGLSVTVGLAGGLFGSRPVGILNEMFGWQALLYGLFLISLMLSGLCLFVMPNASKQVHRPTSTSIFKDLKELLSNEHVWAVAVFSGLMVGPLEGFADGWGVPFFQVVYGLDAPTSQTLLSLIFFGFCFGAPLLGYLGEKYKKPYSIIIYCALAMALIYSALLIFKINNLWILYILMMLVGVLCAYQIFMIFINTRVVKPHLVGISSSFTNMILTLFGSFFHVCIGWIMVNSWDGQLLNGMPVYADKDYIYGLIVIPLTLWVAFFGFWMIKPKNEEQLLENKF